MRKPFALLLTAVLGFITSSALSATVDELPEHVLRGGMPNVFAKLQGGGGVGIAYLGGSITAQAGYRVKTFEWFKKQFPQAQPREINAAIGGTGSDLGVFRLGHDVLDHKPDLVFVEFAVNDSWAEPAQIHRWMEGIVRQIWKLDATTDICFVYTVNGDMIDVWKTGTLPRSVAAMEQLAEHYAIPSIHFGLPIAKLAATDKLITAAPLPKTEEERAKIGDKVVFAPDKVHPHIETGHQIYYETAVRGFEKMRTLGKAGAHELKTPFVVDNLEKAKLIPLSKAKLSAGWQRLPVEHKLFKSFGGRLPEMWHASQAGDSIEFKFKGTAVGIYDLLGPDCGQVIVTLDGKTTGPKPRFDAFCTYHRLASFFPSRNLPEGEHTLKLEIHPDQADKVTILARNKNVMDNPKRYDGRVWYAGGIMLIGDLVP